MIARPPLWQKPGPGTPRRLWCPTCRADATVDGVRAAHSADPHEAYRLACGHTTI